MGDVIVIHLKNFASRPYSLHPHGVFYNKDSEGKYQFYIIGSCLYFVNKGTVSFSERDLRDNDYTCSFVFSRSPLSLSPSVLPDTINQVDLIYIYKASHPLTKEYTFFTRAYGTLLRIDNRFKRNLNNF